MTCLNVIIVAPDRIIAGSDSELARPDTGGGSIKTWCSKIFPIAHLPALVAGRGLMPLIGMVAVMVAGGTRFGPAELDALDANIRAAAGGCAQDCNTHVVVAAWDAGAGRFTLDRWDQSPESGFRPAEPSSEYFAPWDRCIDNLCAPKDADGMAALVRAQAKLLRRQVGPSAAAGGKIIFADLREHGISLRTLGSLDE